MSDGPTPRVLTGSHLARIPVDAVLGVIAGGSATWWAVTAPNPGIMAMGAVTLIFGCWIFWVHGGAQITAVGLYSLAVAVFVGFAAVWWGFQSSSQSDSAVVGTVTGYWATLSMYLLWWRRGPTIPPMETPPIPVARWAIRYGVATAIVAIILAVTVPRGETHIAIAGLGFLTVAVSVALGNGRRVIVLGVGGLAFICFYLFAFSGYGRMHLVALGLIVVVGAGVMRPVRGLKPMLIAAIPVALVVLVELRRRFGSSEMGVELSGLGSIVNPVKTFGELVKAHGETYSYAWGESFLATLLFWVPRRLWPEKPDGFGSVLADILRPELEGTGYSMAALTWAEWYYNFGWAGVVMMVVVVGWGLRMLDSWRARIQERSVDSPRDLLVLATVILLSVGCLNLMWEGSFTFMSRAGQQLAFLWLLLAWPALRRPSTVADRPTRVRHRAREG